MKTLQSPSLRKVELRDPVFAARQRTCLDVTIPATIAKLKEDGHIALLKQQPKPEGAPDPWCFWDSDVAKVMEGMAYALALRPDPALEALFDDWSEAFRAVQRPDGYINSYVTQYEEDRRFVDMARHHELYCIGHLMEAAAAGYGLLGKRTLFDALCRSGEYLAATFGLGEGQRRGWPGHPEIELALAKMYRLTGRDSFRKLLAYFINDRGTEPNCFAAEGHGETCWYEQAEKPLREMTAATGHAVRMLYLLCGIADLAGIEGDAELLDLCKRIYRNIAERRMYITGGVGSCFHCEVFTADYDLTNGSMMYAESCATMALALFSIRLFNLTGDEEYLDTAERCLYNGILSGISLKGDTFFYTNYLEVDDNLVLYNSGSRERKPWFRCSCCPTSFARFLPQLGRFLYSVDEAERVVSLNIPAANRAELALGGETIRLDVASNYPYDGAIRITLGTDADFTLKLRIPGWCRKWSLAVNGKAEASPQIRRAWKAGDVVELRLEMPVEIVRANAKVTCNAGRVALMRGPLVYALEEIDQSAPVRELLIRTDRPMAVVPAPAGLPEGTLAIEGEAVRAALPGDELYTTETPRCTAARFRAVPYALWQNRGATNMMVWVRETADR